MRTIGLALLALLLQDTKKDLKEACGRMDQLKSYHFTLKSLHEGEEKFAIEGEYHAPAVLHIRSDRNETARNGEKKLVREKDGEWKEPGLLARKLPEVPLPHEVLRKIVDQVPALKKEKSTKIGAVTVDIYVHSLANEGARKAFEAAAMPLLGSMADWTKTQNGILFYVGRDDLIYKVEQRLDGKTKDDKKIDHQLILEFGEMGRAKLQLPEAVKEKLGVKEK